MSGGFIEDDYEVEMSSDGTPGGDRCLPMEALTEWRSSEQVENGITSTSPPYWDTDEDDDECGAKPSELYGKSTWKIENFSQINKRELRSNAFEVGGYKWYILIYPQGCDVCNHLSLFLCVANHDKLLPGWSHFAQFTIAVVNKDVKKSKYSDTLHRFWKKEHDWGWKKFMELSKVLDGFIDNDTLVIKAQVQVIRDRADRPFRCLDCLYRRELVRVYLTNVEQICRRFVEERRGKLVKLIEDKARWSSFCDFWSEVDQGSRRRMSREKTDAILRVVVKHFFIEKEVTTTLVMDSLYSGLRALTCQSKSKKARAKLLDTEETPAPIVRIEKDMFVLAEDVLVLLERASLEPLPPKDEKGPQNRTKDGCSGEDSNKDPIERDERRLTELGRRTIEIFVLAHIFSNRIEVAHQEAVALKKQEELIREEEAAGQAESEHKGKRGATEKEKRAKKKQSKQKRGRRKVKDKGKDAKSYVLMQDKQQGGTPNDGRTAVDISFSEEPSLLEKSDAVDDVSNGTDTGDDGSERLQHELENQDACELQHAIESNCTAIESDCSGVSILVGNEHAEKKKTSVMDDSSSTCSTDSVISVVINGPYIGTPLANNTSQTSPRRRRKPHSKETRDTTVWGHGTENQLAQPVIDLAHQYDASKGTATRSEPESLLSLKDRIKWLEQHLDEKQEEVVTLQKKLNVKDVVDIERPLKQKIGTEALSSQSSITEYPSSSVLPKPELEGSVLIEPVPVGETHSNNVQKTEKATSLRIVSTQISAVSKPDVQSAAVPPKGISSLAEKPTAYEGPLTSRPSSAPIVVPKPCAPVVSMGQTAPALARSVSATGRLGLDPSPATNSYVPSSYRNAMMGKNMATNPSGFVPCLPSSISPTPVCSQSPASVSSPMLSSQSSSSKDQVVAKSGFTFGSVSQDVLQNRPVTISESSQPGPSSTQCDPSLLTDLQNLNIYGTANSESRAFSDDAFPTSMSGRQTQGMLVEEFPHLDIINSLFDEEYGIGKTARATEVLHIPNNSHHHQLNRQYTFPGDISMSADTANCCRFDRPGGYHDDGMHRSYGSPSSPFDRSMNAVPQVDTSLFANGQIDRVLLQNQWPASVGHMPSHGRRNTEGDLYSYQIPDYSNLGCGVNGYTMFRPSNGH